MRLSGVEDKTNLNEVINAQGVTVLLQAIPLSGDAWEGLPEGKLGFDRERTEAVLSDARGTSSQIHKMMCFCHSVDPLGAQSCCLLGKENTVFIWE